MSAITSSFGAPLALAVAMVGLAVTIRVGVDTYHRHILTALAPEAPPAYQPQGWSERAAVLFAFGLMAYDIFGLSRALSASPGPARQLLSGQPAVLYAMAGLIHLLLFLAVCWALAALAVLRVRSTSYATPAYRLDHFSYRLRCVQLRLLMAAAVLCGWALAVYLEWHGAELLSQHVAVSPLGP